MIRNIDAQIHELDLTVYNKEGKKIVTSVLLKHRYDEIYDCIEKGLDDYYFYVSNDNRPKYIHFKIEIPNPENKRDIILRWIDDKRLIKGEKITGRYGK